MKHHCPGTSQRPGPARARGTVRFPLSQPRAAPPGAEDSTEMSINVVYAIVKAGGRQEKVSVGDVVVVDKLAEEIGSSIELQPLMLVDGDAITVDAAKLDKVSV